MSNNQTNFFGTYRSRQVGKRGQILTLPSKWCKINGIKPSTELDFFTVDGDLEYLIIKKHETKA